MEANLRKLENYWLKSIRNWKDFQRKAKDKKHFQLVIHTTKAMQTAWQMYEKIGFKRSENLDFMQGVLPVFGFRLRL